MYVYMIVHSLIHSLCVPFSLYCLEYSVIEGSEFKYDSKIYSVGFQRLEMYLHNFTIYIYIFLPKLPNFYFPKLRFRFAAQS